MLNFLGILYKGVDDYYLFRLKDHQKIQQFINNIPLEQDIQLLPIDDIYIGKMCLYHNTDNMDNNNNRWERVILKYYNQNINDPIICEKIDTYGDIETTMEKLYKLPNCICAIEPQLLKCRFVCDISKEEYLNKLDNYYPEYEITNNTFYNVGYSNCLVKIKVNQIDQQRIHYIESICLIYVDNEKLSTSTTENISQNIVSNTDETMCVYNNNYKDYGFDFEYMENIETNGNNNIVSIPMTTYQKNVTTKQCINQDQLKKTKSQLTTKYTNEAKFKPYGVLWIDKLSRIRYDNYNKKLLVPKRINLTHMSEYFNRCITKLGIQLDTKFCQSLCFDYITTGHNLSIVGVVNSGLTTALALPLASKLYDNLSKGLLQNNRLYMIILVRNVSNGRYLEKFFNTIFKKSIPKISTLKIVFLDEISNNIQSYTNIIVSNIIIGSVGCVYEAISNKSITLDNLKYIIFDDAHIILQENSIQCQKLFTLIKQLEDNTNIWSMASFNNINLNPTTNNITTSKKLDNHIQLVLNSHKWNLQLDSFISTYIPDTLLFITDPIEMLAYLPSNYSPHLIYHQSINEQQDHFLQFSNMVLLKKNLLVFTRTAFETEMLYELCLSKRINVLRGTGYMDPGKIHDLNTIWCATRNSNLHYIFIISDCALSRLTITDAIYTYHYTIPLTKMDLRNRLGCSLTIYQSYIDNKSIYTNDITYYMAVCTYFDCTNLPYCFKHITTNKNTKLSIDVNIIRLYKSILNTKQYDHHTNQLCQNLKLYGRCYVDKVFCKNLHSPYIINAIKHFIHRGSITFTVTSVRCCTQLYGIIEKFTTGDNHLDNVVNSILNKNRIELLNDLSFDMQLDDNKKQVVISSKLHLDYIYACKDQKGAFYRCQLLNIPNYNSNIINVYCIDLGVNKDINTQNIYYLPAKFQSIQPLAYEFIFCEYIPKDIVYGWPNYLNIQVNDALIGRTVHSHIRYGYDNIIWIDSLFQKSILKNVQANVVNFSLGSLLKSATCSQNSNQLKQFIDKLSLSYQHKKRPLQHDKICVNKSLHQSNICELSSEYMHIHVDICNNENDKDNLEVLLQSYINEYSNINTFPYQHYQIGELCVGRFVDGEWYRAKIIQFNESTQTNPHSTYNVYMFDIGEYCNGLSLEYLIPIPYDHPLLIIPDKAIKCIIYGADFDGLNGNQLDIIFDYFDKLQNNLYIQFVCDTHKLDDMLLPIVHHIYCYKNISCNDKEEFSNILLDLFLDYHVKPKDDILTLFDEKYSLSDNCDPSKVCEHKWEIFLNDIKNNSDKLNILKNLLNNTLNNLNNITPILNNSDSNITYLQSSPPTADICIEESKLCVISSEIVHIKKAPKHIDWYETIDGVINIRISVDNPTSIYCDIDEKYLSLMYQDTNNGCDIKMQFYKNVQPTSKTIKETCRYLYITVKKQKILKWTTLFNHPIKLVWVTYNFDKIVDDDEEIHENNNINNIDWTRFNECKQQNNITNVRLPENDDYFEPTSSELSGLNEFYSDIEDHEI